MSTNYTWSIPIEKLMIWRGGSWSKYDSKMVDLHLRVHYDQLIIFAENKILETLNMNSKMKGVYKEDVLILIVCISSQEIRKLKFQVKSDALQCFQKLGHHFPVVSHNHKSKSNIINCKYRNIDEVIKSALEQKDQQYEMALPCDFQNFMKMCLLDPRFPRFVSETQKILQEIENN